MGQIVLDLHFKGLVSNTGTSERGGRVRVGMGCWLRLSQDGERSMAMFEGSLLYLSW